MKKVISLLLVAVMLCAVLTGCGNKESQALVGTWKADMDVTELMTSQIGADMAEFVTLNDVVFTMVMTFTDDGEFEISLDEASVDIALQSVLQSVKDGTYAMLEAQIADMGLEMSVEEVLAASGTDLDTVFADLEAQMDLPGLAAQTIAEASGSGNFEAKDGKLHLSAGLSYQPDPASYEVYSLEGDVLTLYEYVGDDDSSFDGLYPLVFHKN